MNSNPLGRWLIQNSKALGLRVKEATWIKEWLRGSFDMQVSITIEGQTFTGSAMDKRQDLAFIKAGAEALERYFCLENSIHSNGVAAHIDKYSATKNSILELKERDAFLCHYVTREPFSDCSNNELKELNFERIKGQLQSIGLDVRLLQMTSFENEYGSVALIAPSENSSYKFSGIIGIAYGPSLIEILNKALYEALRSTTHFLAGSSCPEKTIGNPESWGPKEHRSLFLGENHRLEFLDLMEQTLKKSTPSSISEKPYTFRSELLQVNHPLITTAPIFVVRSESSELQSMFYGPTVTEKLNIERLKIFSNTNESNWRYTPHCIG